jgi:hypothetical protein
VSWDAFQRQVLNELGHAVYVVREVASPPATTPIAPPIAAGTSAPHAKPAAAVDAALLARLARAAGLAPAQLLRLAPDLALQAAGMDAQAKRALWPRLRALRRSAG